jgi:DNA-binding MarR family transcriptional regulator
MVTVPKSAVPAPPDPFETLLGYHLRRLSVLVMADLTAALAPLDLKPADASVLFLLAGEKSFTQSTLGRALGIQRANMAPLIAALAKRGLIERAALNGRSQTLSLTPAGKSLQKAAWRATLLHEARMFGQLPAAQRDQMLTQLASLWQTNLRADDAA